MEAISETTVSFTEYIDHELLVLIPVILIIGKFLKQSRSVNNKWIPLILGGVGIALSVLEVLSTSAITSWRDITLACFTAIVQGILCSGAAVYSHQLVKNTRKKCGNPPSAQADQYSERT